jgi:membrane-associated phospholipid phosphatase
MSGPLWTFVSDTARVFALRRLPWHLLAIALTFAIVAPGLDGRIAAAARGTELQALAFSAGRVGFWVPIALPLAILAAGALRRDARLFAEGWRVAESELIAVLVCGAYKAVTGRPGPTSVQDGTFDATSRVFRFGFLRGGLFWGWPSSHVMTAFAGVVALALLRRGNRGVAWIAAAYTAYMAAGVSVSFHWFSDAVAGAIVGTVVGVVVAESARPER